jgi:hypothetical protein
MNEKIIFGVILSCFLLLVTPCISAAEYNEVRNVINNRFKSNIQNMIDLKNDNNILISTIVPLMLIIYLIILFVILIGIIPVLIYSYFYGLLDIFSLIKGMLFWIILGPFWIIYTFIEAFLNPTFPLYKY